MINIVVSPLSIQYYNACSVYHIYLLFDLAVYHPLSILESQVVCRVSSSDVVCGQPVSHDIIQTCLEWAISDNKVAKRKTLGYQNQTSLSVVARLSHSIEQALLSACYIIPLFEE